MANQLKMAIIQSIQALKERGWSCRRIARELGVNRETVSRYVREREFQNQPEAPTGSDGVFGSKPAIPPLGSEWVYSSKPAISPPGSGGRKSACEAYRESIQAGIDAGLSCQRIWQDLKVQHGFEGSYYSVKRFVRKLRPSGQLPFRRMECGPGDEAQVDFGSGAMVVDRDGKRRRTHVFRIVLSHSRKGYSEAVFRQTTENFIRCIENAFQHFRGVPKTLVIDNLRAAVTQADWYEPELNPKISQFCNHYGIVILPAKPYTPRHKGKIERGIGYVKDNALKGRSFSSISEINAHLLNWERSVADTRIHGTTRKQVSKVFEEIERAELGALPIERFPFFHEAPRIVHRDGHIEIEKAYYSAPPEYLGRKVWARWDSRVVRIFNQHMEQIAIHVRVDAGRFSTLGQHIADEKISGVERGAAHLLKLSGRIGPNTARWSEETIKHRGVEGMRAIIGLLSLAKRHRSEEIERACEVAFSYRAFKLRIIRELIKRHAPKQDQFEFIEEHPIIRPLSEYEELVRNVFQRQ